MKDYPVRVVVALISILVGLAITSVVLVRISPKFEIHPAKITLPRTRTRSEEILRVLIPNGRWGDASQLHRFERSEEIQVLTQAKVEAHDDRAIAIAFLLAVLAHEYEFNKGKLLEALEQCASKVYPEDAQCYDFIADYLMALGRRGDASVLDPLFNVSDKSDGHFSESLGVFYSDMLSRKPMQFIRALRARTKNKQRKFCSWAERADGGGIKDGMLRDIRHSLNRMSTKSNNLLAPVARNCLLAFDDSHKENVEFSKSLMK